MPDLPDRPYVRVREITEVVPVSKGTVFAALKDGTLKGKKLGKVLLIDRASVEAWIDSAEPWGSA